MKKGFLTTLLVVTFLFNGFIKHAFDDKIVNFDMIRRTFTLELGMICADKDLLVKIKEFKWIKKNREYIFLAI